MDIAINPPEVAGPYLAHLNQSFGDWGDEARFRWAFERVASAPRADLMVLAEGGQTLAGSAVTYRLARLGDGTPFRVGIMTGSWTLPAARGRGCFTRVIHESLGLCRQRGATLLLAFVTEDNASYRRLKEAGSTLLETRYWIFPPGTPPGTANALRVVPPDASALLRAHDVRATEGLRFSYDVEGYRGQFLARSLPTEVLESDAGVAVIERAATTDRVLALYPHTGLGPQLAREVKVHANAAGRGLFAFTDTHERARWFEPFGVAAKPGFMTVLAAAEPDLHRFSRLALENGDRM